MSLKNPFGNDTRNPSRDLPASARSVSTLVELLRWRAGQQPSQVAYTFLLDGETQESRITYGELDERARAIAVALQSLGAEGERALLLFPPGLDYIAAFFGCLYAGAVAVPAYPPRTGGRERQQSRLDAIVNDCQPAVILGLESILSALRARDTDLPALSSARWLATDSIELESGREWRQPSVSGEMLAFLQYTSGSTATPKGVMVTHANLLHNQRLIQWCFGQEGQSVIVGWLPLYHDMGLIGNVLHPLYVNARCILMSPTAFLQKPLRWLQAISNHRATTSGGPNFAYDLCARKITDEQCETLDLSSWETAFNGAEPVRHDTMERFAARFGPFGFRREAFSSCYGLAEATLIVTGSKGGEPPTSLTLQQPALEQNQVAPDQPGAEGARTFVSSGEILPDEEVEIVETVTATRCTAGRVGEVWVAGPSVARGYWGRPSETEQIFGARLAGGEGPFLRTGDLGFFHDGQLFVIGRLKDLIVIRGRNLYPQDIELTVELSHGDLRPGGGAAFSVEVGDEERLVVVQEVEFRRRPAAAEVIGAIRQAVAEEHEVQLYAVVLIKPGTIPKTSSGKIQRSRCRAQFEAGEQQVIAEWRGQEVAEEAWEPQSSASPPLDARSIESWLTGRLAAKLGLSASQINVNQPITFYGIDSMLAVELAHETEAALGFAPPLASFLRGASVADLAALTIDRAAADTAAAGAADTRREGDSATALSYGQKALWFLHQLTPTSAAYNLFSALHIQSALDVTALRRAFQSLVTRHASLRTTFHAGPEGEPVRRVWEQAEVCFQEDAADWSDDELTQRLQLEAHRPFDLERGPLMRVSLFRRSPDEHVLLLSLHHIIADFWSLAVLADELGALYREESDGTPSGLAPVRSSYSDYVRSQAELLSGPRGAQLWAYWKERLAGAEFGLNLPTDRPRLPVQTYNGASEPFALDAELSAALKSLCKERGATLYMLLLAAFQTLLHRHTGQKDLVVGSPVSGRDSVDWAGLVGYFVNPLVLRASFSDDPTFEQLLSQVRRTVLDAFEHQEYPFPLLVERLQPERDASQSPLFQTMFVFQKAPPLGADGLVAFALGEAGPRMQLGQLAFESVGLRQRIAQFDLTLTVAEVGQGLAATLEYNTDLFDPETVRRMAGRFQTLLRAIAENPSHTVSALPILTAEERRVVLGESEERWGRPGSGQCLHQLFERQAELTPDGTAVVWGAERLSYRELDERANRIARRLSSLGVGPESRVGVLLRRSPELISALLGVLKAGGCYVPLDPEYPPGRLSFMLEDASACALVTEGELLSRVTAEGVPALLLEELDALPDDRATVAAPRRAVEPGNLAYLIYTSGSTGRPKAVSITHASASALMDWAREVFTEAELSGVLASTSVCFDLSVFELFAPLSCGGKVILADSALELPGLAGAEEVTLINTVPSAMAELVRERGIPAGVKVVNLAGEELKGWLAEAVYEAAGVERVLNLYGPSEDTTYSTWCEVGQGERVTIGRPVANTRAYVVDEDLGLMPLGVPGELVLGGEGLARGYLGRPELTAERFIPDPYGGEAGGRLYRTGDLVRKLGDGRLDFLGRMDHQVKVRGFRVELGEVEAVLLRQAGVAEAVVVAREEAGGELRLVAYLSGGSVPGAAELRAQLKETLPEHMVPSGFVVLERLPQTANGKVDRKALPEQWRPEGSETYVSARGPLEEMLAGIWSEVLGVERVGVHDNFFELGGHSLLATRVVSRVRSLLGIEVALQSLFTYPTLAELAAEVAEKQRNGQRQTPAPPLVPVERGRELPLLFAQRRLWFIDQLEPGSAAYNIPCAVRLTGRLDADALAQSLNAIIARHEALRTSFPAHDGEPIQQIHDSAAVTLGLVDLTVLDAPERKRRARELAREEAALGFDLERGPLVRGRLLRLREDEHLLLLTMHHIVSDGWSLQVFVRELTRLYEAYRAGAPSPLPPLPVQYADFAVWQREWLQGSVLEEQVEYWRRRLADAPLLELPTDRPRPLASSYKGASEPFVLSEELTRALKELSRREGVTIFMTLLAGLQTLLARYSGNEDIVVGSPIANRNRVEIEGLIGFFVNTFALRTDLSGNPSVRELLRRVRETTLGAYAHQDVPFEKLVEELQPQRSLSHQPYFQVMLAFQNVPRETFAVEGLEVEGVLTPPETAKFDLSLSVADEGGRLQGTLEYAADLYDSDRVRRLIEHLRLLLQGMATDVEQRVFDLPMLSADESRQLLVEFNDTASPRPLHAALHRPFERQAALHPERVALTCGHHSLTYGALNERASRLAHYLRERGVGPETLVGVCCRRRPELVVALLGVLKAGAAYLPLDPAYPTERLRFMLEDAAALLLLTEEELLPTVEFARVPTLCLDRDWCDVAAHPMLAPTFEAGNLAYLIYTSGSTGRPKGVAIEHRSVAELLAWASRNYAAEELAGVLASTSVCFDLSVFELFVPLSTGGTVVLADSALALAGLPQAGVVTLVNTVPSAMAELVRQGQVPRSVRTINLAGEALTRQLVNAVYERTEAGRVVNLYGPSEDTTYSTVAEVGAHEEGAPTIGRPVSNTRLYVLGRRMEPTPLGVAGEVCLAGAGLARGYLNRPELTAERFVPDPHARTAGARMYRTGDVGRWRGDGEVEYLGRADHQVKVRGFRIELGEIEAALLSHEAVQEAVVVAREAADGELRLVAYLSGANGHAPAPELRAHLKRSLPEHMVPSAFVVLERLPLTPNGKVDRKALPEPEAGGGRDDEGRGGRTAVEELVSEIWAGVLGLERIGVNDNFFELGGHSLLATRLLSRLAGAFGVEVTLRSLFESPTVAALAELIESELGGTALRESPPLVPGARGKHSPLSFAQQRLWFLNQLEPDASTYNMPAAFRLKGDLSLPALEQSLDEIVRRHEVLRARFQNRAGLPVQVFDPPAPASIPLVDLSGLAGTERETKAEELTRAEAARPFDLARGPLLRARLLRLDERDHLLVFTIHHIVADGWSAGVLVREMAALYEAFSGSLPAGLPELPVQYADFARWQAEWLQTGVLDEQIGYWKRQLGGRLPVLELPTDRPRPPARTFRGARLTVALPPAVVVALKALSRREGVTLYVVLMAAFKVLLSRYTGVTDIVVGAPFVGRRRTEVEGLIGFFVNTLALRTELSGDLTFRELLTRERDVFLEAYAHQDVPFEKLVEVLQPERSLDHLPLFQVMLAMEEPLEVRRLAGLEVSAQEVDSGTARFDLTVWTKEGPEGLTTAWEYDADLFDAATVKRMGLNFQNLLESIAEGSDKRLQELDVLTEEERRVVLGESEEKSGRPGSGQCLHQLFERQAELTPDGTAVVWGAERLSYRELDERANRIARRLSSLGVGSESRVGVLLRRSPELVSALLGVLKAGGCYVPLDPEYPPGRLSFMLEDASACVLVTERDLLGRVAVDGVPALLLEELDAPGDFAAVPRRAVEPGNLAYLIYTSGSTGRPKAVSITHASAAALMDWAREVFTEAELSGVLASTSVCFDLSVFELFAPLSCGGKVILADSALELPGLAGAEEVTLINTVPSAMAELVRERVIPAGVKVVNLAGEELKGWLADAVYEAAGVGRVLNLYGPSEDTTYSTWCEVGRGERVTIGRPVANTRAYVVDEGLGLMPLGVPGELVLGGEGLARGYLGRPELTAERFIPDPYGGEAGGRLYRTGDLVRKLGDGRLDYLGRMDHQVKVRGFRVELGEVEAALLRQAGVAEAVVVAREEAGGELRLVAYLSGGSVPGAAELRAQLKETLPEHMVPSGFVELERLPQTANGKVDRKALPEQWRPEGSETYVGARGPLEEMLAGIWSEVLGVERVGVHDNFFELGGHSLLATRVVSRIRETFGVELPVREMFQTPTVAELARAVESARGVGEGLHAPPLTKVSRDEPPITSFAQERLWFLEQLEPGNPFYNVAAALRLSGRLDVAALGRALNEVVRRHETLRTTFESVDGRPVQVIAPEPGLRVELEDLSGVRGDAELEAAVRRRAAEEAARPFDLARGPLFRCRLLKLHEDAHVLVVCIHHIISDGWSLEILIRETGALYEAYSRGAESPLAEPEFQYSDYAAWQRARTSGAEWDAQLAHWKGRLAGAPAVLELPSDRPRPAEPSFRGARRSFHLGEELTGRLRELGRREGVTTYMLLLAAFKALLHRYSGQTDIVVGTPVANRGHVELEGLIGFFLNTLALRTDLSGDPTFAELLSRVREVTLDGFSSQEFPFEKLVEELQPERSLSHAPLFQVMFTHQTLPPLRDGLGGLRAEAMQFDTSTSKFDLTLSVLEGETDLQVEIEYSLDLFGADRIERMEGHFTRLLREAAAAAGRRISQLEILSEAEREQITNVWNDTARKSCGAQNVVELFERQVRLTPDAPAVICGAEQVSYGQLNVWSNRIAHHLRRLGVGVESLVGVCTERSSDMIAAVVAIFKAGAAYVPLDPAYPAPRLSFMLEESRAEVVLTQKNLEGVLCGHGGKVICLDADRATIEAEDGGDPPRRGHLDNLGYVIYTSGSTGKPKGIGLPQRALLNLIEWHLGTMKSAARTLQFASLSFDASFHEMFAALCSGGAVVVATEGERKEVRLLADLLKRQHVEKAILPVIVAQQLAEECAGEERDFGELTEVTTTGEQLQVTAGMVKMFKQMSWSRLHNHYGPSESHVVTAYSMPSEPDAWVSYPPIGKPIWNTSMYVLDARMRPTPVGVPGELYIGGVMLARGYLKRPDLTAEKFIPDPFSHTGGERLYRTGDLSRYLEDGNIEYLGRIDQQVKIRGFRVELEEIEAVLRRCEGVAEAAVQAVPDGRGGKRLVGYIAGGGEVSADALVRSLRELLPDYMVPALYVKLDRLPLTPNGKLDRRALPVPDDKREAGRPFIAPRTGTEELLVSIWGRVLRRRDIGVRDNFFELGGHSLLATQVVSRVREAFGVELELRALFDAPMVAELAREVERLAGAGPSRPAPPLLRAERVEPQPLSFAQQRLWFFDQLEPGSPLYHVPIRLKLTGPLNVDALSQALDETVRRHESLRTVFSSEAGSPVQIVRPPAPLPLSLVDLTGLPAELRWPEALKAAAREAVRPFDLERGPLLRARLLRLGEQEHIALLTIHHIVSDGWSLGVLVREMGALYGAFAFGRQSPLLELEMQYADYAVWQRRWLEGEPLAEQAAYWSRQLAGVPQSLELPTDMPRSSVRGYAGAHRRFRLRAETVEGLKALCEREGVTLFMVLVAAFKAFLSRHSNQDDIVVGTDIANRHHASTEGLIGFFVNQLVLRTKLSGDPTFVELLKRVRAVALGAYAHQDMPFDKLVELLNPGRGTGRTPLFQAKLVLQNTPAEPLELSGLKLEPLEDDAETGTSRFDLMLTFVEDAAGLSGVMEYSTELFEVATAARLLGSFERLLESAVAQPDARLGSLDIMTKEEAAERAVQKKRREASGLQRLKAITPKTLGLSRQELLKIGPLRPDAALPLLVEPNVDGVDLAEVIGGSRELIEQRLSTHGALLFRGFNLSTQGNFEEFLRATPYQLMRYMEGATPRTELSEKVYTSTEYPSDQHIALHNELTYVTQWPMKIWFFCQQPSEAGGETPIADVRGVYNRIPPRIRDRFVEKGWMLTRNFGQSLSLSWQTSFHTEQAAEVESYCRSARIEWEWRPDGGLRTRQTRPVVQQHPQTREMVWFNHVAFWHVSSLEAKVREAMLAMFREEDLPYNTYYGDGSRIEESVVAEIREAYRQERLEFPWRAGDILMLDNMLVAHGRNPYSGLRRVLVAMA